MVQTPPPPSDQSWRLLRRTSELFWTCCLGDHLWTWRRGRSSSSWTRVKVTKAGSRGPEGRPGPGWMEDGGDNIRGGTPKDTTWEVKASAMMVVTFDPRLGDWFHHSSCTKTHSQSGTRGMDIFIFIFIFINPFRKSENIGVKCFTIVIK